MKPLAVDHLSEAQIVALHGLFQMEWWTRGRQLPDVRRMLENSDFVFGLCDPQSENLLAFARVLSDRVYKALILDVIVQASQRRKGLGKILIQDILDHPNLHLVKHFELYCRPDMVPYYAQWGFKGSPSDLVFLRHST